MKRRRSSAPGRRRRDGRGTRPALLAVFMGVVLAACGQAGPTSDPTGVVTPAATAPGEPATTDPSTTTPTDEPAPTAEPATAAPTTGPSEGTTAPSVDAGSAAACSGSDENRDFYASMAAAVDWTVYCPVLPDGWFVDDGQYRLANGGWMQIGYDGPGDARILLLQGVFCEAGDGCVPSGNETGDAAFGDRLGRFVAVADGSWAVVVDRGASPSWLIAVEGLDEAAARTIAADLHPIAG